MKQTILARRYAKALFAVGKEEGKFEEYNEALQGVAGLYVSHSEVADALTNPLYPLDIRQKVMAGMIASMGVEKIMANFLNLLVEKKRAGILPEVAQEYQAMVDNEKNVSHGSIVSAIELSEALQVKVRATLEKLTGKKVELTVISSRGQVKVPVELARSPRLKREMKKYRNEDFEFTAREVSFFDRVEEQWSGDQLGVLVEDVRSGSWAELGSLSPGDLILEVNGQPAENVDALRRQMERIAASKEKVVVIKVLRGIHTSYLEIEPNWKS